MRLDKPWAAFLPSFAWYGTSIVPAHIYGKSPWANHPANLKPIGTGPFKLKLWEPGKRIVVEKNDDYFGPGPYLDQVEYRFAATSEESADLLMRGEADLLIGRAPAQLLETLMQSPTLSVVTAPADGRTYLTFNLRRRPLDDVRVRRAINMALDRRAIVDGALGGLGAPAIGFYTPAVGWAYNGDARAPSYDPGAARRLISASVPPGYVATLLCSALGSGAVLAEEIAAQLAAVGLRVRTRCVAPQEYFRLIFEAHDFDLAVLAGSQGPDPDSLTTRFGSNGGSQIMGYSNAELDAVLARGGTSSDLSVRTAAYFRAQEILAEDLPIAPLVENVRVTISRVGVRGLPQDDARGLVPEFMYNLVRLPTAGADAMTLRFRDWPWALKLGLLLVATAILPLSASTLYSDVMMRREQVANASLRDLQRARNTAVLLDEYLRDLVGDTIIVALAPPTVSVLQDPDSARRATELQALLNNVKVTKRLPELFVLDNTGTIVASTDSELMGRSRISAPYFLSAIAGQVRAHDPRYLPDENRVDMHVASPVRDARQRIIGVVSARVPLDQIDRLISGDTGFGGLGEYGLLWDERGIVISSPASPEYRFRPLASLPKFTRDRLIAERRFGPETAALVNRPAGADALVQRSRWLMYDDRSDPIVRIHLGQGLQQIATAPMRDRRWTYAIVVPEAAVLAQVDALSRRNLAVALGTALLALGLAIGFARRLSRPLSEVGSAARALAGGDLTRRVRLAQRDEIGQMANAFDAMADAIAQKDTELRQHAESLERRVDARTAELRGLLSAIPDLMFRVDRQGRLVDYVAAKDREPGPFA